MDTRNFDEAKKNLINKFETTIETRLENINMLRAEIEQELSEDLSITRTVLIVAGVVSIIINLLISILPNIVIILILFAIYFIKKIKQTFDAQNILRESLETLVHDYISAYFTPIGKKSLDECRISAQEIIKEIKNVKQDENIILTNVFSGKYNKVDFAIVEASIYNKTTNNRFCLFNGVFYKIYFNGIYKNNTAPKELLEKINKIVASSTFD